MTFRWLDRGTVKAPYMTLCLTEADYMKAVKHCKLPTPDRWMDMDKHQGVTHVWATKGKLICIVCLHPDALKADPIEVAGVLVHEAVHVFQRLCDSIGEDEPSREFEAYSIGNIAERLMREFVRQTA